MSQVELPPKKTKKKVAIETWGCQMNVADSEEMLRLLQQEDYQLTEAAEDADLIVLNTCHIREKARHKVVSRIGRLRKIKSEKPDTKIAVTGCVAQAEGKGLFKEAPEIDVLVGPGKIDQLPALLHKNAVSRAQESALGFRDENNLQAAPNLQGAQSPVPTITGRNEVSRFVNISQGCDNFCTFCVVPHTRGREISSAPKTVVEQVHQMVQAGAKEITLLGQNVNSYGQDLVSAGTLAASDKGPFVDLLTEVAGIEGLERLRFTTSNPHDFTRPLAELLINEAKLGRYLHLPVQSGDDEVLERMKRKVTAAEYLEKVSWLRSTDPEYSLSTDIIVGFPGESKSQFENTLKLLEEVRFSFVYAFMYSTRPKTPAARFREQVPESEKKRRLAELNELQNQISLEGQIAEIGLKRQVLIHYASRKEDQIYYGRTPQFRLVRVESSEDIRGQVVDVTITDANKTALVGELCT